MVQLRGRNKKKSSIFYTSNCIYIMNIPEESIFHKNKQILFCVYANTDKQLQKNNIIKNITGIIYEIITSQITVKSHFH